MKIARLLAGTAVIGVATIAMSQGAMAVPYAQALNQITGITIIATPGPFVNLLNGSATHGITNAQFDSFPVSGFTVNGTVGSSPTDAPQAAAGSGPFPGQNDFGMRAGFNIGMIGSRGDAFISANTGPGSVSAANVAESRGAASGSAKGEDTASVNFTVNAGNSQTITFSFSDAIYLEAMTAFGGDSANATIHNDLTIRDNSGKIVFEFAPSGAGANTPIFCGGVQCGTALSDPFNLQTTANSVDGSPLDQIIQDNGFFSAVSLPLGPGKYNISIVSQSDTVIAAPEPAAFAVLGAGLLGLALVRRRRPH